MRRFGIIATMCALLHPAPDEGSAGGGGEGNTGENKGEGSTPEQKLLTEEQVNRIVAQRLAKERSKHGGAASELEAARTRLAEIEAERDELRGKLTPTDAEKAEAAKLSRENARLTAEVNAAKAREAEATTKLAELTTKQKTHAIETVVRKALATGGAHERGLDQAVRLMVADGAAELDDDGVTVTIDRVPYTGDAAIAKAAQAWLTANPHFAKAIDGGSGGRRPTGGGAPDVDMDKVPARSLISAGLRRVK